jgi:hypothetical protein
MSSTLEEEKNQAHAIIKINPKNISRPTTGNKQSDPKYPQIVTEELGNTSKRGKGHSPKH